MNNKQKETDSYKKYLINKLEKHLPSGLNTSLLISFDAPQLDIVFKLVSMHRQYVLYQTGVLKSFIGDNIINYYYIDVILTEINMLFKIRKSAFKVLAAMYLLLKIVKDEKKVNGKNTLKLFHASCPHRSYAGISSIRWLVKNNFIISHGSYYTLSDLGLKVIRYYNTHLKLYNQQFIKKQAEMQFLAGYSKI